MAARHTTEPMSLPDERLTLMIEDGVIEHVFYPVFQPDKSAAEVIDWLRDNAGPAPAGDGVVIYTTASCPHCKAAKALLTGKGVAFTEIDVERDPAAAGAMLARSGRRTVPQVFVGGRPVGGADDLRALDRSGQLASLLTERGH